jgi:hypothetical protein
VFPPLLGDSQHTRFLTKRLWYFFLFRRANLKRKWARSTLVLVPLFGVQYTLFLALSFFTHDNPNLELFWLFGDQITSAFQVSKINLSYTFFKVLTQFLISSFYAIRWSKNFLII